MDTAQPQPDHLLLPLAQAQPLVEVSDTPSGPPVSSVSLPASIPQTPIDNSFYDLWLTAGAEACGLVIEEFGDVLTAVAEKFNCGLPPGTSLGPAERASFLRGLRLEDLALAAACALGREVAWQRFLGLYRAQLTQAAVAITGSATLGNDLADSLYAELYGIRGDKGDRRSPLASYSGRGSLLGWLRTTLAQRYVDHHRRTRRETPLDDLDAPAPDQPPPPVPVALAHLTQAVASTLQALVAEDRFLLSAYFLDRQTLLRIAQTLHVHEATISRRIKRLTADLRNHLLDNLQSGGLSKRGAEEALGADPRDLEINLRALLQTSQSSPFQNQERPDQEKLDQGEANRAEPSAPVQS